MRLVFDLETDGLDATKVHCLVTKDVNSGEVCEYPPDRLGIGILKLQNARQLIGHNILGYDLPVLRRLYKFITGALLTDTMVLARLHLPDPVLKGKDFKHLDKDPEFPKEYIGSHSLAAWGRRLGDLKDDKPEDFSTYTPQMLEYCKRDVEVTYTLAKFLESKQLPGAAQFIEHQFAQVCEDIEERGFWYDIKAAEELAKVLIRRRAELTEEAKRVWPGWETEYFTPKKKLRRTRFTEFNPTSRDHISRLLQERHQWKPKVFTDGGKPKVDEAVLATLPWDEARLFGELFLVQKRLGYLCEGPHSLLQHYRPADQRIHGRIIHNGTVTSRCAHVSPNLAQVPRVGKPYGKEFRSLFGARPGWQLVGCDAQGLELRCLAHYMAEFDDGAYAKAIIESDIHTENQKAAGLPTRDNAKTFIYAFLYGAGDEKLGKVVGGGVQEGRKLRQRFLRKLPALRRLQEKVHAEAASQGWLAGLDGRKHYVRSEHAALNVLLQSAGALVMKWAAIKAPEGIVAHVHDEMQIEVPPGTNAEGIGQAAARAISEAGAFFEFRCPLAGEWKVGRSWYDTH